MKSTNNQGAERKSRAVSGASESEKCIHELFEFRAASTPDAVALVAGEVEVTYGELNGRANQLARFLVRMGLQPDERVAICMRRSVEMVVGLLGVLKAGGAYVPLDPTYPTERLEFMLDDSAPRLVLTHAETRALVAQLHTTGEAGSSYRIFDVADDAAEWADESAMNVGAGERNLLPGHLAYVIYTSGSTGTPKGAMLDHRGLRNLVEAQIQCFGVEADSRVLQFASFSFDACISEIGMALCRGAALCLPRTQLLMGDDLLRVLEQYRVTHVTLPPAVLAGMPGDTASGALETLIVAGDVLPGELLQRWIRGRRVINAYGPTEATVCATAHECAPEDIGNPPIGRAIANVRVYVLDEKLRPVPPGVTGEIYIAGAGVGRGYIGRADLTAERFVPDPFARGGGERMYATGDRARHRDDGNIEFVGRKDFQVKVRGFRIELGEIEAKLREQPGVGDAAVLALADGRGERRLVAYYTAKSGDDRQVGAESLKRELSRSLPEYMLPAAYVRLEALPLTVNGKLDRKALPEPGREAYGGSGEYEAPEGEVESTLARLWEELLKVERVGRRDNFFALGGHSLIAVSLIGRMRSEGLHADVQAVFRAPVLCALAAEFTRTSVSLEVPPNGIEPASEVITPEMVTLVQLTQAEIDCIVSRVPGGARNVQDIYPLTALQEGILFHHLLSLAGDPYVLEYILSFDDRERLDMYLGALRATIQRHDILRTSVQWKDVGQPVQVVWREAELMVEELSVDAVDGAAVEALRTRYDLRRERLDLVRAPLMRVFIAYDVPAMRWRARLLTHHLICDHVTLDAMQDEIRLHMLGQEPSLPAVVPFRAHVAQSRQALSQRRHEPYFRQLLGDVVEGTVPFGLTNVRGDGAWVAEARREVDAALAARVHGCARELGVAAASLCHVAWALLLARVSSKDDVVFGTVLLGRMQGEPGADRVLGMLVNTLPFRLRVGVASVRAGVMAAHAQLAELLQHEHAPLAIVQRCSGVAAPEPLFTAVLNFRHGADESIAIPKQLAGVEFVGGEERTNYPLVLSVDSHAGQLALAAQAQAPVDPAAICELMVKALEELVEALEREPTRALERLDVMPASERERLVVEWNRTEREYAREKCLHELFEEQVVRAPSAVALVYEDEEVTYGELNARANQLAHYLVRQGLEPDERVGICMRRSVEMVVGLLGVLKAGGAYVPLDPAYPAERLQYMLEDSGPRVVVTHDGVDEGVKRGLAWDLEGVSRAVFDATKEAAKLSVESEANPERSRSGLTPRHLAYVIYTSGSTGKPKGVMVHHGGLTNYVCWARRAYTPSKAVVSSSYAFDATVTSLFVPLICGAPVRLLPEGDEVSGLDEQLKGEPGLLKITPAHSSVIGQGLSTAGRRSSVEAAVIGGEALPAAVVGLWRSIQPGVRLVNEYGPTETVVGCIVYDIPADFEPHGTLPIGRPISNTRAYVLDARGRPCPVGVTGELYIGGDGVTRGYLGRPDLTAERYLPDAFSRQSGARVYRTGDLARFRGDGELEFLGRNDRQVKIRGFRIELDEIENRLVACSHVADAVVVLLGKGSDSRLVAYYVIAPGIGAQDVGAESLKRELSRSLPEYMLPAAYVRLEALPLTVNGKLDRKALPEPGREAYGGSGEYEAPEGEVESTLARLWEELLKVERVGRRDNFFALGGHSLIAVSLMERMRREGLSADVGAVFVAPTLMGLAAAVKGESRALEVPANGIKAGSEVITPEMVTLIELSQEEIDCIVSRVPGGARNVQDIYPLAPLQEGMMFHHLLHEETDPYLLGQGLRFESRERLESYLSGLRRVIARHDVLRTAVQWEGLREPVQVVWREADLLVEEVKVEGGEVWEELRGRHRRREYRIELARAPLMRVLVAAEGEGCVALMLMHHLACDHVAVKTMAAEVNAYVEGRGEELAAARGFREFVAQTRLNERREERAEYFRRKLGEVEESAAPFGLVDVLGDGRGVSEGSLQLGAELSRALRERARELGVSVASVCHLAWALVLSRASGRQDVVFGTVLLGRMGANEGAEQTLGVFINTLPLRLRIGKESVEESVRRTQRELSELLEHEHASLALAQRCSGVAAPAALFSAVLNYRHMSGEEGVNHEDLPEGVEFLGAEERTNYPLVMSVNDYGAGGFELMSQAGAPVKAEAVCELMVKALEELVEALEREPTRALERLDVMPASERERLVVEWNRTEREYAREKCLHELFEEQVVRAPSAVALVFGEERLTYRELNQRANRLAHHLRRLGVGPEVRVALCVERSSEMVVGLLAVLKAGGCYVPLDTAYPPERLAYMLEDSAPAVLLTRGVAGKSQTAELLAARSGRWKVVDLHADSNAWAGGPDTNPEGVEVKPEHLTYVMYTSGSTGKPKAVMVEHGNVTRLLSATAAWFEFNDQDVWPLFHSYAFDVSVWELWGALTNGGRLVVVPWEVSRDPEAFYELLCREEVTVLNQTPSAFRQLLPAQAIRGGQHRLRTVVFAGEALDVASLRPWYERPENAGTLLVNMYGITETTVHATYLALVKKDTERHGPSPIGRRIPDLRIYVLDERMRPVPVGVVGELYVAGAGVSRGYMNRPELTAERFVPDAWAKEPGARSYRSGDLGRYTSDGSIEYLGRNDSQVKVRGFRIELGEIESRLAGLRGVKEAVVLARRDGGGEAKLVAYYVSEGDVAATAEELRRELGRVLPEYMVPAAYVRLESLPLTVNGKLNRRALPEPARDAYAGAEGYEAPVGEVEETLARLWQEVLKVERIGRQDNFFALGGHSLVALRLTELMRREHLQVDVRSIFTSPTLMGMAAEASSITEIVL